jgi:anaerobic selenocysteine-containing dehydrogenase
MQALTGLFARQFGTPNYAAHGGFCSVNMAAGMIYTIGGSFWEFGGPDLDRAKLFVMIGTAEDHHSNPMKIALSKFKRAAGASSRSTRCAPAIRRSPTNGFRSSPAPTARCCWR